MISARTSTRSKGAPRRPRARRATGAGSSLFPAYRASVPEKIAQNRSRAAFTDAGIDIRHVMACRRRKEPHAADYRAALFIRCPEIKPPDARERNRRGAHRTRFERHV